MYVHMLKKGKTSFVPLVSVVASALQFVLAVYFASRMGRILTRAVWKKSGINPQNEHNESHKQCS